MPLIKKENPILSKKCQTVDNFDEKFRNDLDKVIAEHISLHGVGLAAPQIGIDKSFAVIGFEPTEEDLKKKPDTIQIDQFVIVNPVITWHSDDADVEKEGCLSIPESMPVVPRYKKIHLDYQDEFGNKKKLKARGYLARIIQHEVDHLNGKTIARFEK
ncbi:MAG: Peptide deformylase [candidate division WS2 bacterium ADurb.Bin280]|uniref:Peptide deformylase n=1 Tax=candidate division WS2 bacterium ADurb.Bin280 TaxID=1852829 RepID=A0A1V5SFQ2_9BACT|nr:MAG: Peptide deformylase [candidate division WS2 bacterium ADurb.Bin280]